MASPAAAVLDRRRSRTTPDKRKQSYVESEGSESGSDGEWSGDDDPLSDHGCEDEDEDEDETVRRGRVRPHTVVPSSNGRGARRWAAQVAGREGMGSQRRIALRHEQSY